MCWSWWLRESGAGWLPFCKVSFDKMGLKSLEGDMIETQPSRSREENVPFLGFHGCGQGACLVPPHLALSLQSSDSVPAGYEPISLLEALNGLRAVSPAIPSAPLYEEITYSGISDGLSQASCPLAGLDRIIESGLQKGKTQSKSPDR